MDKNINQQNYYTPTPQEIASALQILMHSEPIEAPNRKKYTGSIALPPKNENIDSPRLF